MMPLLAKPVMLSSRASSCLECRSTVALVVLVLYARFIGDTADYVLNQLIDTTIAKDRDFMAWRAEHPEETVSKAASVPMTASAGPVIAAATTAAHDGSIDGSGICSRLSIAIDSRFAAASRARSRLNWWMASWNWDC